MCKVEFEHKYYEWACFGAHQSTEKSIKAIYYKIHKSTKGHSLLKLLEGLKEFTTTDFR
jgi:HEPN domain-containing protein